MPKWVQNVSWDDCKVQVVSPYLFCAKIHSNIWDMVFDQTFYLTDNTKYNTMFSNLSMNHNACTFEPWQYVLKPVSHENVQVSSFYSPFTLNLPIKHFKSNSKSNINSGHYSPLIQFPNLKCWFK